MAVPLVVVIIAVVLSSGGGAGGMYIFQKNKYNKYIINWQEEKKILQGKLLEYQYRLMERDEIIIDLKNKLNDKTNKLLELTHALDKTDSIIETLKIRQEEINNFKSKIFRLKRINQHEYDDHLSENKNQETLKKALQEEILQTKKEEDYLQEELAIKESKSLYYSKEIDEIKEKLNKKR